MHRDQKLQWYAKTLKLNVTHILKLGDEVIDVDNNKGIVVKIIPGSNDEDHGTVYVWQSERYEYGADNCEHYTEFDWKKHLRVLT